jgi:hypothetical protein
MSSLRSGIFCLALTISGLATHAAWGQTKNSSSVTEGGWHESAARAAPAIVNKYRTLIEKNSAHYGNFPAAVVTAIILTESVGQEHIHGGLTQINPNVLRNFGLHCSTRRADCSVRGAVAYLSCLFLQEHGDMRRTIVAYNHGYKGAQHVDLDNDRYLAKVESILPTTIAMLSPAQTDAEPVLIQISDPIADQIQYAELQH